MENDLLSLLSAKNYEKTSADKVLAKDDVNELKNLMVKEDLTRADVLRILYLVSGNELKLVNFEKNERYVMTKLFVWMREFVQKQEHFYDYEETLKKLNINDEYMTQACASVRKNMAHQTKFLVDLYLNICRSSLSKDGVAFDSLLKGKFELATTDLKKQFETEQKK